MLCICVAHQILTTRRLGAEAGGGLIDPATFGTDQIKLIGSFIVYAAENLEAARKFAEQDIYYTANVVSTRSASHDRCACDTSRSPQWDKEKMVILPWTAGMPLPPFNLD